MAWFTTVLANGTRCIAIMFIFMTSRRYTDYVHVFSFLFDIIKEYFHGDISKCKLKYIMMDFERAMWKAFELMINFVVFFISVGTLPSF